MADDDSFMIGEPAPDKRWWVIFEDDGETGYLYLCRARPDGSHGEIVDALWTYNKIKPAVQECEVVEILWSEDSKRACLHVDQECWAILDLAAKRKLHAPRDENRILPLPWELFEKGLEPVTGEPLRTTKPS